MKPKGKYAELSRLSGMGAGDPGALKGAIDRCKNELQRDPDNEALAAVLKGMNDFAAYYAAENRFLQVSCGAGVVGRGAGRVRWLSSGRKRFYNCDFISPANGCVFLILTEPLCLIHCLTH